MKMFKYTMTESVVHRLGWMARMGCNNILDYC